MAQSLARIRPAVPDRIHEPTRRLPRTASKTQANINRLLGPWSATVEGKRYSSVPNNTSTARRDIYATANVSGSYAINKRLRLTLIVNNVADTYSDDKTGGWPNYSQDLYDEYGRQ